MPSPSSSSSSPSPLLPTAARGRRRRPLAPHNPSSTPASGVSSSSSSSSSWASSNLSSLSFPPFSPAPSPFHHRFSSLSPLRASAVPFSWEHRPGIPKTPARVKPGAKPPPPLPLPPSLFSNRVVSSDTECPFAASSGDDGYLIVAGNCTKTRRRRKWPPPPQQQRLRWPALPDWLTVLSPYRSCTRSRDSLAAVGPPPLPRPRAPA